MRGAYGNAKFFFSPQICYGGHARLLEPSQVTLFLSFFSRWEDFPKMNSPRAWLGLEWVPDGRLFAVGGIDGKLLPTRSVEMLQYSRTSESPCGTTWRYVARMLESRVGHGVCYFAGKLLAAGGRYSDTVECFTLPSADKPEGEWTKVRPLNKENTLYGLLPFSDGLLCKSIESNHFVR